MLTIGACVCNWTVLLLLCTSPLFAQPTHETTSSPSDSAFSVLPSSILTPSPPSITTSTASKPSTASYPPETTCLFRTINYITHTLPQQCLRTGWSAPIPITSLEGPVSATEAVPSLSVLMPGAGSVQDSSAAIQPTASPSTDALVDSEGSEIRTDESINHSADTNPEAETDSPFDNANFLSFEEWKAKNLARAGQSPENVGQGRSVSSESNPRRRPVHVNALDSLGEDSEIELDFSGFGSPGNKDEAIKGPPSAADLRTEPAAAGDEQDKAASRSWALSRDAGKTCKERFNYASFDCAGTVLKTNREAKSSSSVLVENKDSYMLNECSAQNKFLIVELCDDILVDTVVLANFEFFSSMFRHFRVSVSDRYPVKMDRWRVLGTFEARNSRELQPFLITESQIWARYLRIEFLTHYGNEFYCPVSLLRVHGTTMMEQFRREEEEARGDDDFVDTIESVAGDPVITPSVIVDDEDAQRGTENTHRFVKDTESVPEKDNASEPDPEASSADSTSSQTDKSKQQQRNIGSTQARVVHSTNPNGPNSSYMEPETIGQRPLAPKSPSHSSASIVEQVEREYTKRNMNTKTKPVSSGTDSPQTESPSVESSPSSQTAATLVDTGPKEKMPSKPSNDETSNISPGASSNHTQPQANQRTASATQPNPASPTTQESFFKSIHKRLQQLEANSTLSLQYIEEQSRILRDAFIKVEKRQLSKTETFLMNLNSTVIQELKGYRAMYEQLWQSTVLELEGMRERNQRELGELGSRLSLVADELVWQKRMAVVQSTLLLLCLGLVLFVRSGSVGAQLDVPIVQQLGSKYSHMFNTPPGSPDTGGPRRRRSGFRGMWRSDTSPSGHLSDGINYTSDAATDGARSPVQIEFSPPTPTSNPPNSDSDTGSSPPQINHNDEDSQGDGETDQGSGTAEMEDNEQGERLQVLATQSGPATPRGSRDSRPSWEDVDRAVDMLRAGEQGREREFEMELERERRRKRSPLRRMESYDAPGSDSPDNDTPDEESGVNPSVVG